MTDWDPITDVAERWPARTWNPGEADTWRIAGRKHTREQWVAGLESAKRNRQDDPNQARRRMCPDLFEVEQGCQLAAGGRYAHLRTVGPDDGDPAPTAVTERFLAECRAKLGRERSVG